MKTYIHINQSMKKITLLMLLFTSFIQAQIVNIPDANFKAKLLAADASNNIASSFTGQSKVDTNNNGEIEVSEAANITILNVNASGIADLTGIEAFTSLQILHCENNQLTSLDASNLFSLMVLICSDNQISALNVTGLFNLEMLECSNNQLTTLNLSGLGLSSLRGLSCGNNQLTTINIAGITSLENLNLSDNLLTSLSVSGLGNLKSIQCSGNQLTTLNIASLSHLEILWCYDNQLTSLNITGAMTSLVDLNCSQNQLTTLNIPTLINLSQLRCNNNQLTTVNTTNLLNLKTYDCSNNQMTSLDASGLPLLEYLSCNYNQLTSLTVSNLANLKSLGCNNNLLTSIDFTGLSSITGIDFSYNSFPTADLSGMSTLKNISAQNNQLTSLTVTGLTQLEQLFCMNNLLTSLNLTGLTTLKILWCDYNQLTALDLTGLINLEQLTCGYNQIPSLNLSGMNALIHLYCPFNPIPELNVNGLTNLIGLFCNNTLLTTLDVSGLTSLQNLQCGFNSIPNLNVSGLTNLVYLYCDNNQITSLDLTGMVNLKQLNCSNNQLTTLDTSDCINMIMGTSCQDNNLSTLFIKNGVDESVAFYGNPNLQFICADETEIADIQTSAQINNPSTIVSSYCSFTPGGHYNSVTGTAHFDLNNDGCDSNDLLANNIRFDMTDGTISSGTFLNDTGIYTLYADIGTYTLNAHLENPAYFHLTPVTTTHVFPELNSTVVNQDFCMTANGVHNDAEIVLYPSGVARPGFDAHYVLLIKNKGNQTLSGNIQLAFEDALLDFISASVAPDNTAISTLTWNYSDLKPFETRTIELVFNVNSPIETPPVNSGDLIHFTATINPIIGDEMAEDNVFELPQYIVNSMDPNDITCLEGPTVAPTEIGKYLHYVARFENTGNFAAENIVVKMVIDPDKYNLDSLQLLDASHESTTNIHGNVVEFIFRNINLAASAGDPPVGGHGTIMFKIKSAATLAAGDQVSNKANIYFDYNAPIETNPAQTVFALLNQADFNIDSSINTYPNPAKDWVRIDCNSLIKSVELYDVQGRILQTSLEKQKTTQLDISNKPNGIYFLKINTEKGIKIEKLVKK
ncbi:MAG: leucine-rich repeat domain-containing protein [Flavobacteriaceae bacterium]